ncbi:MAG: YjjG family noncanonical pyrimidine nucleotidase [Clostridia bacterium]|nr:YjjG family noncanonical pyrimidine nucleotidase [Clostridia bacterium]
MVKNILFDLDDTLLDFTASERHALALTLEAFGIAPEKEILDAYHEINRQQWERLERGELTKKQVKLSRYRILLDKFDIKKPSAGEISASYESKLCESCYVIDYAKQLLESLYGDFSLYLVSNGGKRVQQARVKGSKIGKYFNGIFISEEIGFNKPDERFFINAFKDVPDFKREESVILGDSLTSDILGGKNFGIKTVWFNRTGTENRKGIFPDYEIFSLKEFEELVYKI